MFSHLKIHDLIKDAISLQNDIRHLLSEEPEASTVAVVEAIAESIAEASGMVAVTIDDLPTKEV